MINTRMRTYFYYIYGAANAYGQAQLSEEPQGTITMAICVSSQSVQDNINYKDATYVGLTHHLLDDSYVIQYGDKKLKVLYVNTQGRLNQVFLGEI